MMIKIGSIERHWTDCDAKFADVWRFVNVWGAAKEKLRGQLFDTVLQLEEVISTEWKKILETEVRENDGRNTTSTATGFSEQRRTNS